MTWGGEGVPIDIRYFRSPFISRKVLRGKVLVINMTSSMYHSDLEGRMYRQQM